MMDLWVCVDEQPLHERHSFAPQIHGIAGFKSFIQAHACLLNFLYMSCNNWLQVFESNMRTINPFIEKGGTSRGENLFLLERRGILRFPQNAGYDNEYVKKRRLGKIPRQQDLTRCLSNVMGSLGVNG